MAPQFCDACNGPRLKPEILAVRLGDAQLAKQYGARFPLPPAPPSGEKENLRQPVGQSLVREISQNWPAAPPLPGRDGWDEGKRAIKLDRPTGVSPDHQSSMPEDASLILHRPSLPGLSIMDLCPLSVEKADAFLAELKLTELQQKIAGEIIKEIRARLGFLKNVGLGYLTLNRESGTLSGGETQRIRLAAHIRPR